MLFLPSQLPLATRLITLIDVAANSEEVQPKHGQTLMIIPFQEDEAAIAAGGNRLAGVCGPAQTKRR
jgi:hypothetical protein